ncbi:MAG: hypothetical protein A3B78_00455 [Omnitrophica WOR_2 bacterium RIFCSPHIGHO2_02_FULL_67_20]|nr:MAG: hypothetical protein A3B78_00455 [Omnitrophica WOR_2 bacterium RIFCSPHIGHO2_02_FULL_67_20]
MKPAKNHRDSLSAILIGDLVGFVDLGREGRDGDQIVIGRKGWCVSQIFDLTILNLDWRWSHRRQCQK